MSATKYKAKTNSYILRSIADSNMLISVGENVSRFNGYIELNPAGKIIWETLNTPATIDELATALVDAFGIDRSIATTDATAFLQDLIENEMVTEL